MSTRLGTWMMTAALAVSSLVGPAAQQQPAPNAAAETRPSGGLAQGIKVHGHWVIEVRNPDGAIASRHEFDNSLTQGIGDGGTNALVALLTRASSVQTPSWQVVLAEANPFTYWQSKVYIADNRGPCGPLGRTICAVSEGPDLEPKFYTVTGYHCSDFAGEPACTTRLLPYPYFELVGKVTATGSGRIGWVNTLLHVFYAYNFTGHGLSTPIEVVSGQIIQFTVRISFS